MSSLSAIYSAPLLGVGLLGPLTDVENRRQSIGPKPDMQMWHFI